MFQGKGMNIKVPEFLNSSSVYSTVLEKFTIESLLSITAIGVLLLFIFIYILFSSEKRILKWYNAQLIKPNEGTLLLSILENLSSQAGIKTPKIYSFESEIPKIFTVGGGRDYSIAISSSMLKMFDGLELEALLAHEIGHIKNKDVILNTITAFLAGTIMSFPNFAMWCSMLLGLGQHEDPAPRLFRFMATGLAAPPAAVLVHLASPAKREFTADETAVKLTKNPQILAKTLEFLENHISLQPAVSKFNPGHFHLFSTHTQQLRGDRAIFTYMFDTHPETEERVMRILSNSTYSKNNALNNKYARVPGFFDLKKWKLAIGVGFVSWMMPLFLIIVLVIFIIKDFNFLVIGGIAGIYSGAVLFLTVITMKISKASYNKSPSSSQKRIISNPKGYFKHYIKRVKNLKTVNMLIKLYKKFSI